MRINARPNIVPMADVEDRIKGGSNNSNPFASTGGRWSRILGGRVVVGGRWSWVVGWSVFVNVTGHENTSRYESHE